MAGQLKIAIVQTPLLWENPEGNRAMFEEKIKGIQDKVDLVILPEMFTTGFTMEPENIPASEGPKTLEWMERVAAEQDIALLGSMVFRENGNNFNRLYFVAPNLETQAYDKKHTFTLAGEDRVYTAGNERLIVDFKGFRICPMICYDLRFPVWARNTVDYDVLIYVANWPKPRIVAWDTLLRARAIENMAYCIGANRIGEDNLGHEYAGHSAVYDVLGGTLAYSEKEEVLFAEFDKSHIATYRNKLKFLDDRDSFSLK
ncbi:amidohydrolase [Flagellimonas myxillae]|uniref:amidohydrolase n=1 Tax=Flagellimonas myxillae TaxID=2942214 RepID=UPI00201F76FA|nr:amidohydrolase [Muricauda myxillae]MCL6267453.1 amidohydrolase [Muricauda myxillae]